MNLASSVLCAFSQFFYIKDIVRVLHNGTLVLLALMNPFQLVYKFQSHPATAIAGQRKKFGHDPRPSHTRHVPILAFVTLKDRLITVATR